MALGDLQTALGMLVAARTSATSLTGYPGAVLSKLSLEPSERAWLAQLVGSPGFEVTCYIQRWWRETRLRWAACLTLAVLAPERSAEVLNTYLNTVPCLSLFFVPEAVGFLSFVIDAALDIPHLDTIARFERAPLLAADAGHLPSGERAEALETAPAPFLRHDLPRSIIEFAAPPEQLLGAILLRQPLPQPGPHKSLVVVSPNVSGLWRSVSPEEARRIAGYLPSAIGA
jgi:hypothetical protein